MIGRGIGTAAAVVGVDQLSKHMLLEHFGATGCTDFKEQMTAFFDLVLTCNRGMSFGLLNSGQGLSIPLFTLAAAAIVGILVFWLSRVNSDILSNAIGLIIGGAIGNVIDRLQFGGVIDFLLILEPSALRKLDARIGLAGIEPERKRRIRGLEDLPRPQSDND